MAAIQLSLPSTWNHQTRPSFSPVGALSRQARRLLTSIDVAGGDAAASHRLVRKFVSSSSKSVALGTLTHLLSSTLHRHSSIALPMYQRITETAWFSWNSKLVSNLIAFLEKQGFREEAETLTLETIQKLGFRETDTALFYTDLIHFFSKNGLKESVFDYYARLKLLLVSSSTCSNSSLKRKAFESMINALCVLDLPSGAEGIMEEMGSAGVKPSGFEFRLIALAYGRLGLLGEMGRVVDEMEKSGYVLDTVCFNILLSSYGTHGKLSEMVSRIQSSNVPFSIRTYNTVLNSCPTIISMLQDPKSIPLSVKELVTSLPRDEAMLVGGLIDSLVLAQTLEWSALEGKLDLHGMHLGTVYVIMLQWIEELRSRFSGENTVTPTEITVVCGLGKHSSVRGESPVKALVSDMFARLNCPMRIDRKNTGCFVAKGKNVRDWLC